MAAVNDEPPSELLAALNQKNKEILRAHPEWSLAEFMTAASIAGYQLGMNMAFDTMRLNNAMHKGASRTEQN